MSDEKSQHNEHDDSGSPEDSPLGGDASLKRNLPPLVALAFVIVALMGVLIGVLLHNRSPSPDYNKDDLTDLQSEVDARRAELNRQRVAMGLSPLDGSSEPIGDIADRLKKDADSLVSLATRYQEMLAEKDKEMAATSSKLLDSEKLRRSLYDENNRLQGERDRALIASSDGDRLRADLASMKDQRDALSQELAAAKEAMRTMHAGVSAEEFAELQRRFDEARRAKEFFEARVAELEGELSKARLFARSEDELLPAAVALVRTLRKLEDRPDSDLTTAYSKFGLELGANVLQTTTFATGSFALTPENQEMIRNLGNDVPDGDLLLVVGYSSRTGNPEKNQTLSSDRATAVAEHYSHTKRPGQLVQAVYLGQTARFSSRVPERNQLCEIWRIRKK